MNPFVDNELEVPEEIKQAAGRVRLIVMDVDGVLTDGRTYQLDNGEQFIAFGVQDSLSMILCGKVGLGLATISGRDLPAGRIRMGRFPNVETHWGVMIKEPVLLGICERLGVPLENTAYIGDDIIDLPLLRLVGFPVSVPNGVPEARRAARYVTDARGGEGAVRELITLVLKARGLYRDAVERYLREH